jgi:hypothetical protein
MRFISNLIDISLQQIAAYICAVIGFTGIGLIVVIVYIQLICSGP